MSNPLIDSLLQAVSAQPQDLPLRLHLAELLIADQRGEEAIAHCATALQQDPGNTRARELMGQALTPPTPTPEQPAHPQTPNPPSPAEQSGAGEQSEPAAPSTGQGADFDWGSAEEQFRDGPAPMFVGDDDRTEPLSDGGTPAVPQDVWEVEQAGVTLADVGGMAEVKERLELSFLAPMRNPELRELYGKSLRGGLLLYGPPGCGKTFLARAVAGEMGAGFINVSLSDVLDMYIGNSEGNLHELFQMARRRQPAVLFFDEIDALGQKRSQSRHSALRGVTNQLLQELDGVGADNEGVYVLAATNTPWDVDPALRRPGRLDRSVLVLPPDEAARAEILQHNLSRRPIEGINVAKLAATTDGFTGADLAHLCEGAAERAMMDSVRSGKPRMITMKDLTRSLKEVRPSAGPWFDVARNVVTYADRGGEYDDLRAYMQRNRLL